MKANNSLRCFRWMSIVGVAISSIVFNELPCPAQCQILLRETFRFGERPHGGNGQLRVVELEDRLHDYWPQVSSIGARWISADQAQLPLWQFSWSSADPAEIDPPEGPDGNGTAFGEPGAAAMIPFGAPATEFTLSVDLSMGDAFAFVGFTTTTAFVNNFEADGALWMSMNANGDWTIRANGNQLVATGHSQGGGALNGGFYRLEMTYDPVTSRVRGSAAGEPFGPFTVTLTRPLSYFGMEAHDGWCTVNNLSIYGGPSVQIGVEGPQAVCLGGTAVLAATSDAQAPSGYFWYSVGGPYDVFLSDGIQPSGAVLSGTNTNVLEITNIGPADLTQYACFVANDCGLNRSEAISLQLCRGDLNADNIIDASDIPGMLNVLLDGTGCSAASPCCPGDTNGDGSVNGQDVAGFVQRMLGLGSCP